MPRGDSQAAEAQSQIGVAGPWPAGSQPAGRISKRPAPPGRQSPSAGAGHAKKEPFVTDGSFLRPTTPRSQIDVPSTPCYNQRIITTLAQTLDERKR